MLKCGKSTGLACTTPESKPPQNKLPNGKCENRMAIKWYTDTVDFLRHDNSVDKVVFIDRSC